MNQRSAVSRISFAPLAFAVLAMLSLGFFLRDVGMTDLRSWGAAAAVVASFGVANLTLPRDSLPRALVWFVTLPLAAFFILYAIVDALLDPFVRTDWPIAAVAVLLVLLLQSVLLAALAEDD